LNASLVVAEEKGLLFLKTVYVSLFFYQAKALIYTLLALLCATG